MKLYTKTGDDGTTGLFGGQRVNKDDLRVEAYGTVDELNAIIGLCLSTQGNSQPLDIKATDPLGPLREVFINIQSRLFEVGADLATPHQPDEDVSKRYVPRLDPKAIEELESAIDLASDEVPAMTSFILPGGCETAARLHVGRTVCRRAERLCVSLSEQTAVNADVVIYLNRLSDLLFAAARLANYRLQIEDIPWISPRPKRSSEAIE